MHNEIKDIVKAIKKYIELEEMSGGAELLSFGRDNAEEAPLLGGLNKKLSCRQEPLETLKKEVVACDRCELYKTRTHVVFGNGNPKAKLMFVGEAPGMEEDRQGLPFVGMAGKLLTKIIESIGLKRKDVYIANILKCRPPNNRDPLPTEILSCEEYLIKQIEIIRPKVICALGKFAAQTLLRSQEPITKLRGRFYDYRGTKLMPTFHPAYLLRNPQDKRLVWEDMKMVRKELSRDAK